MATPYNDLDVILQGVGDRATDHDRSGDWPAHDLRELARAGALRWSIPADYGGDDLPALDLHLRYERIATASVATALILTQRDSAVSLIADQPSFVHRRALLHQLCSGDAFATVGIAQLTTSRRYGDAALRADREHEGWRLRGVIPWSTGAGKADYIVAGAVTADGNQLLFVLPTSQDGVTVDPPIPLVALQSSWTAQVRCDEVHLPDEWILAGPAGKVLGGRSKSLPAGQAFIATGLCRTALDLIRAHPSNRAAEIHPRLDAQLADVRRELLRICHPDSAPADPATAAAGVRGTVNDLAVRLTHTAIALYKGSSLMRSHPAQRLAREAMFLLVWSCPSPVVDCTVAMLVGGE